MSKAHYSLKFAKLNSLQTIKLFNFPIVEAEKENFTLFAFSHISRPAGAGSVRRQVIKLKAE